MNRFTTADLYSELALNMSPFESSMLTDFTRNNDYLHHFRAVKTVQTSDTEKNFNSEFCGKAFQASGKLEKHQMNMHLKLRPHVCSRRHGCGVAYSNHSNRNLHDNKKLCFVKK